MYINYGPDFIIQVRIIINAAKARKINGVHKSYFPVIKYIQILLGEVITVWVGEVERVFL